MNIIEKLGIKNLVKTPVDRIKKSEQADYTAVNYELLRKKEIEYMEMLETLIEIADFIYIDPMSLRPLIEKITDMKWEEIKKL